MNERGKNRIGLICAIELDALFKHYSDVKELDTDDSFKIYYVEKGNFEIYILQSGMGVIAAASGVQYLITKFNVSMIVNYGVVGGLTGEMSKHKICVVDKVVHYKYDCSEFMDLVPGQVDGHDSIFLQNDEKLLNLALSNNDLIKVICCSGDKFIGTAEEKSYLHEQFKGEICDMESAGINLTCERNKVPCLMFKAVSDGLSDGANGFYAELEAASLKALEMADAVLEKLDI